MGKAILGLLLVGMLYAASGEVKPASTEGKGGEEIALAMVVRGGVSLGAYEAGYSWALVKALNRLRSRDLPFRTVLRTVTGASAGSINALLIGMYWCQRPDIDMGNRVDHNLFYDTWVDLGLEDLLVPPEDTKNRSTLFSRRVLKKKAEAIVRHLRKPIYRNGCEIPLGFAVTKANPIVEEFQGIEIRHQAFSIPLTLSVRNRRLSFRNRRRIREEDLSFLQIPGIDRNPGKIIPVLFASSAFPGAFEQVKLRYRYRGKIGSGYFIDGGIYNNSPLSLAVALDRNATHYLFIEPDNLRRRVRHNRSMREAPPVGFLMGNLAPLAHAADVYQNIFLYQAINKYFRGQSRRRLLLTSRWHPLTAGFLEHFGAFLDRNFRLYDYHVGVYDALYQLAAVLVERAPFRQMGHKATIRYLAKMIGLEKNREASTALRFFIATEFHERKIPRANRYASIYFAFRRGGTLEDRYSLGGFEYFLRHLNLKYLPHHPGTFLAQISRRPEYWYKEPLQYIINRVTLLENYAAEADPGYEPIASVFNAVAWGVAGLVRRKEGWEVQSIHVPRERAHLGRRKILRLLPKEIAFDAANGGLSLGYEASYFRDFGWIDGFQFRASYNMQKKRDGGDFLRLDTDLLHQESEAFTYGFGPSLFGNVQRKFWDSWSGYGANFYVDFMERFRATYVYRHGKGVNNHALYFGIENLPSLYYWLTR